jgi:1,4-dihydroxy-2-naphthoyl-CoA hydrolase
MSADHEIHVDDDIKQFYERVIKQNNKTPTNLAEFWGMKWKYLSKKKVVAHLPITDKVRQPYGRLHGGASVAFAETLASIGAILNADFEKEGAVGLEINANHVRPVGDGYIIGTATPIHIGRKTHVWGIEITTGDGKLVCVSRCTVSIIPIHTSQPRSKL